MHKNSLEKIIVGVRNIIKSIISTSLISIALAAGTSIARAEPNCDCWKESNEWTITSYGDVDEALYSANKVEVFDAQNNFLGYYKQDFLNQVKINGSGLGEGIGNDKTKYLHYDYDFIDRNFYYLNDFSAGAYGNKIIPWTGDKPSIAINPVLLFGSMIRFKNLGHDSNIPQNVKNLLLDKTFYSDDRFYLNNEDKNKNKIDIYVGLINPRGEIEQSLKIENATILIRDYSCPDFNADKKVDLSDLEIFTQSWLSFGNARKNSEDFNCSGEVDFVDYAILADKWNGNWYDFKAFSDNWLSIEKNKVCPADLNSDGGADFRDYVIFADKWNGN